VYLYLLIILRGVNFIFLGADREEAIPPHTGVYSCRDIDAGEGGGEGGAVT